MLCISRYILGVFRDVEKSASYGDHVSPSVCLWPYKWLNRLSDFQEIP